MTNEEKAKEIARKYGYIDEQIGDEEERYKAVLEGIQWKQSQMVEKAWKWLEENTVLKGTPMIKQFIKYMEEQL